MTGHRHCLLPHRLFPRPQRPKAAPARQPKSAAFAAATTEQPALRKLVCCSARPRNSNVYHRGRPVLLRPPRLTLLLALLLAQLLAQLLLLLFRLPPDLLLLLLRLWREWQVGR